ncbi:MAG: DUF2784 domain-containing protein [Thermodesulfovibrionales bacterium]|nr:DUF2784 domain-containing protein [Thermodesulfovibrionales bacterium]
MPYKIMADAVVLIHFLWIVFLIFGAVAGARNKSLKIFHVSGLGFALLTQMFGFYCPLTYLEAWLRARHNPALAYSGSFIVHYMEKIIYIEIPHSLIIWLTVMLCAFNAWFYLRKRKQP